VVATDEQIVAGPVSAEKVPPEPHDDLDYVGRGQPTCLPGTFTEIDDEIALAVRADRQGTADKPNWSIPGAHVETRVFLTNAKGRAATR